MIAAKAHSDKERYVMAMKLPGLDPNNTKKYGELFSVAGEVVLENHGDSGPRKAYAAVLTTLNNVGHHQMYNTCTGNPKRDPALLWMHTGEGRYIDKVTTPHTHIYKGGKFVVDTDGTWARR